MICKFYHPPPIKKGDTYIFYDTNGKECIAGPWKGELKGWCRYLSPKFTGDVCIYLYDKSVECKLKGGTK